MKKFFQSRTIWTGILLAVYNATKGFLPENLQEVINEDFINTIGVILMFIFTRLGMNIPISNGKKEG